MAVVSFSWRSWIAQAVVSFLVMFGLGLIVWRDPGHAAGFAGAIAVGLAFARGIWSQLYVEDDR